MTYSVPRETSGVSTRLRGQKRFDSRVHTGDATHKRSFIQNTARHGGDRYGAISLASFLMRTAVYPLPLGWLVGMRHR